MYTPAGMKENRTERMYIQMTLTVNPSSIFNRYYWKVISTMIRLKDYMSFLKQIFHQISYLP